MQSPLLLFLGVATVFYFNGHTFETADTLPARFLPVSLLMGHDFYLEEGASTIDQYEGQYFVRPVNGHPISTYPPWGAILALPVYLVPVLRGGMRLTAEMLYDLEKCAAVLIMALSVLHCSMRRHAAREAVIIGTKRTMRIHAPVNYPSRWSITLHKEMDRHGGHCDSSLRGRIKEWLVTYGKRNRMVRWARERCWASGEYLLYGTRMQELFFPPIGHGLHYQVAEVIKCLRVGQLESNIMPLD